MTVLENAVEEVRLERAQWRVLHIPLEDMYTVEELKNLESAFLNVSAGRDFVDIENVKVLLRDMEL